MSKVIVYQGSNECFRVRLVDDEGNSTEFDDEGRPVLGPLYATQAEAITAALKVAKDSDLEVEVRETIAEVAARGQT